MALVKGYGGRYDYSPPPMGNFPTMSTNTYPPTPKKKGGSCFMSAVILIFVFEYFSYVGVVLRPLIYPSYTIVGIVIAVIFNFLFFMTIISYIRCVITDPGRIPRHWAFYRGDVHKRRRYCKQCNAWKPDRTHHCSSCSRCVLNMDHHCPWINNCVGFYNRKFFLQLLIYGVNGLAIILVHSCIFVVLSLWRNLFLFTQLRDVYNILFLGLSIPLTVISGILFFAMAQFAAFHVKLVSSNLTTIENLDYNARERGTYDLGLFRNCQQVFGPTILLWWFPYHSLMTAPVGDGVRWTTVQSSNTMDIV